MKYPIGPSIRSRIDRKGRLRKTRFVTRLVCLMCVANCMTREVMSASLGVLVRLHGLDGQHLGDSAVRLAAAAAMAVHHVNTRNTSLVPEALSLLPDQFSLSADLRDSKSSPATSIGHLLSWVESGSDLVVGAYRSAVSGPLALAASVSNTPVLAWGSTASSLSNKRTYPTLGRVVPSDAVLSFGAVQFIDAMRWRRFAIVHVDDAWGSAFAKDAAAVADAHGIEVSVSQSYLPADASSMDNAVRRVVESGSRIVLIIVPDSDIPAFAESASSRGLLQPGSAILAVELDAAGVAQVSANSTHMAQLMEGWFSVAWDPMFGRRGDRFSTVLQSTQLEHLQRSLYSVDPDLLGRGRCSGFCPLLYDAVWAAAIAAGRTEGRREGGGLDKEELLRELRGLQFEGASGPVSFDAQTGDREPGEIPMVVKSVQRDGVGGAVRSEVAWTWTQADGLSLVATDPPVWIGGTPQWALPQRAEACARGHVFSPTAFVCEPCPPRTDEVDGRCVPYSAGIGLVLRLHRLDRQHLGDPWVQLAGVAAMALHHVNTRNASLVPRAPSLLPEGFTLSIDFQDSMSSPPVVIGHQLAWEQEGRDMVVGTFRSAVAGPLALAASVSNTPVLAWGATASSLSDKSTYPTLSRVPPSDAVIALGMVKFIQAMNWTRIAVVYLDDAWGRGFASDTALFASQHDIVVATMQKTIDGHTEGMEQAVRNVKESGARIVLLLVFEAEVVAFAQHAKRHGMLEKGYVVITGDAFDQESVVSTSESPADLAQAMSGWFQLTMDPMFGAQGDRFQAVLEREPVDNMRTRIIAPEDTHAAARSGRCSQYCPLLYDAVWAAAIAAGRTEGRREGGGLDKEELLRELRGVQFEGASGPVSFDAQTGDRGAGEVPVVVLNFRAAQAERRRERLEAEVAWTWTEGEGLQAQARRPPVWIGGQETWVDIPSDGASCAGGEVFDEELLECVACEAGKIQTGPAGGGRCVDCEPGTFSDREGSTQCSSCKSGFQRLAGQTTCSDCPVDSARLSGTEGIDIAECLCVAGTFRRGGPGTACEPCVPGAECEGFDAMPYPLPGYWGDRNCSAYGGDKECPHWDSFLECSTDNCRGGPEFECKEGSTGNMCLDVDEGHYVVGGMFWLKCGRIGTVVTLLGTVAVLVIWFGINHIASGEYDALNVALLFLQITGLISTYSLRWHENLNWLNTLLNIANFDVDFVTPYCLFPWSASAAFYLQLLLPFVLGIAYALYFTCRAALQRCTLREEARDKYGMEVHVMRSVLSFILIVYHTQVLKCFSVFRCSTFPDGREFLWFSPEIECWKAQHWSMVACAITYIPVVLMGLPAFLIWEVWKHMKAKTLHSEEAMFRWGFVHQPYETSFKFWEAVIILRRLLIAGIAVTISEPMLQGSCAMIVLTAMLAAHTYAAPYVSASIDLLDFASIAGSMLYTLAGLLMYPNLTIQAQNQVCLDGTEEFCRQDAEVKEAISYAAWSGVGVTLLVAALLTFNFVREKRHSRQAASAITHLCRTPSGSEGAGEERGLEESVNKVALQDVLEGTKLLRWAQQALEGSLGSQKGTSRFLQQSPLVFAEVDRGIRAIPTDLTQYSDSATARIVRALCEIPGLIDFLSVMPESEAYICAFFEQLASFVTDAEKAHAEPFPMHSMVKFEHRPLIMYYLMAGRRSERRSWRTLMDGVLVANKLPSTHSRDGQRNRRASQASCMSTEDEGGPDACAARERDTAPAFCASRRRGTEDRHVTVGVPPPLLTAGAGSDAPWQPGVTMHSAVVLVHNLKHPDPPASAEGAAPPEASQPEHPTAAPALLGPQEAEAPVDARQEHAV